MERLQGKVAILSGQQGETPVTAKEVTQYEKSMTLWLYISFYL